MKDLFVPFAGPTVMIRFNNMIFYTRQTTLDTQRGPIMYSPLDDVNCICSHAHLTSNGIFRFGEKIGEFTDITIMREVKHES